MLPVSEALSYNPYRTITFSWQFTSANCLIIKSTSEYIKLLVTEKNSEKGTGLEGFEPPAFGLEARRYILAKPQARRCDALYYGFFL